MEDYSSDNEYRSINLILDDFSSDIFDGITWIMRPVVGAVDYLKRMHKLYQVQRELKQISNLDSASKEKFLDLMTDIVTVDIYNVNLDEFKKVIENKISETEDFKETFEKLDSFLNRLDGHQSAFIRTHSLRRLNGRIASIREEIKSRIWDENENSGHLLVLDQMFFLIQELIKKTLKNINDPKLWIWLAVSLFRIEAFHRAKIPFEAFQEYISDLSTISIDDKFIPINYEVAFEVLEA